MIGFILTKRTMKKHFLFIFTCFFFTSFYSQTKITVLDFITKKPVSEAHIKINSAVFVTDKNGKSTLKISSKKRRISIEVTHVKYQLKKIKVRRNRKTIIYLKENLKELEVVTINRKRNLQKEIKFTQLENLPNTRHSFASIIKNDSLLILGGDASDVRFSNKKGMSELLGTGLKEITDFLKRPKPINTYFYKDNMLVYNFKTKQWSKNKNKFKKRAYQNAVLQNNNVYIFGGKRISLTRKREYLENEVEVYSIAKDSITIDKTYPHQAANASSVVFDNKILVIGGSTKLKENGLKKYTNKIHLYDIKSGLWYLLTSMKKGKETKSIIINNKLYLLGGFRDKKLTEVETFNLKTGRWKTEESLLYPMENPAITSYKNIIYLFEKDHLQTYNVFTKEIKDYSINLPLYFSSMHYKNGKLYIAGGATKTDFRITPSRKFISIDLKEFEKTEPLSVKYL